MRAENEHEFTLMNTRETTARRVDTDEHGFLQKGTEKERVYTNYTNFERGWTRINADFGGQILQEEWRMGGFRRDRGRIPDESQSRRVQKSARSATRIRFDPDGKMSLAWLFDNHSPWPILPRLDACGGSVRFFKKRRYSIILNL